MKTYIRITPILASLVFAVGCATVVPLSSVEMTPRRSTTQRAGSKVAILPIAARVGGQKYLAKLTASEKIYLHRIGTNAQIKAGRDVEIKFGAQPELAAAYQAIIANLIDRDPNLYSGRKGDRTEIVSNPWNGQSGIKYDNLMDINAIAAALGTNSTYSMEPQVDKNAPEIRLQWVVDEIKNVNYQPLPHSSVKVLSQGLECDYLLIPVVRDSYNYVKSWFAFEILPLFLTAGVYRMNDLAFYLVDGASGEIVYAMQISEKKTTAAKANDALLMTLALHKILQRGDAFGSFVFK